ncbi:hypothetical protein C5167_045390, partial [Papaver somniferum]
MASSSSALILFSLLIVSFSAPAISKRPSASDEKVTLSLYQTLCLGCSRFIVHQLPKIFEYGLFDIVDLNLVPYGNAKLLKNGTIICQHGPDECFLNTVEACAINIMSQDESFGFIRCVQNFIAEGKIYESPSCLDSNTPDQGNALHKCYTSGLGQKLELQYGNVTAALNPPHKYVPWVTVNEVPLHMDIDNFMKYICKAYKGTSTPKACKELRVGIIPAQPIIPNMKVCR